MATALRRNAGWTKRGGFATTDHMTIDEPFDFDAAIRAHRDWTETFRAAIILGRPVDTAEIGRSDLCALGKWLLDEGRALAGTPGHDRLLSAHDLFHAEAARVAELINAGRGDEAAKRLWAGTTYARASQTVCDALRALSKNGGGPDGPPG